MTGYRTSIGTADATSIQVLGQDLAEDLMGKVGFAELAYWLVALRRPSSGELRCFESVLVALADHGLTPSALAARLTHNAASCREGRLVPRQRLSLFATWPGPPGCGWDAAGGTALRLSHALAGSNISCGNSPYFRRRWHGG